MPGESPSNGRRAGVGRRAESARPAVFSFLTARAARSRTGEPEQPGQTQPGQTMSQLQADERQAGERPPGDWPGREAPGYGAGDWQAPGPQQAAEPRQVQRRDRTPARRPELVSLARRMQSLAHREIELLDQLEAKVEDPELLKGLFAIDHLATRMRRQAESLAVLGGSGSRRQWTRSVPMQEVLRAATGEVEQYKRVRVVPPNDGVVHGTAVADVIHLVAELVENATKFSSSETSALVRAQFVRGGVTVEIDDRGLGIPPADQAQLNRLLADPGQLNPDEVLRGGHIGLYVVAVLARRHGIRVRLQNNVYGGTQAVVALPKTLLDAAPATYVPAPQQTQPQQAQTLSYAQTGPQAHQAPYAPAAPGQPDARTATGGTSGPHRSVVPGWAPGGPAGTAGPGGPPQAVHRPPLPVRDATASAPPREREREANTTEPGLRDDRPNR
jgi:hypothetical protein